MPTAHLEHEGRAVPSPSGDEGSQATGAHPGRDASRARSEPARVLLANYAVPNCGVHQYGRNLFAALARSTRFRFEYVDIRNLRDLDAAARTPDVAALLVNYHPHTMRFLQVEWPRRYPVPCIAIMHEFTQMEADRARRGFFQGYVIGDPTLEENNAYVFAAGRLIPRYENTKPVPSIPTVGSFGFSVGSKGFERLVRTVQEEFDQARIRLNIAANGIIDPSGARARALGERCRRLVRKPGVVLEVTHAFFDDAQLLDFLASNTLNAFLYDLIPEAGISSSTDHAMTVRRPVAITRSVMFRHLHGVTPPITIEDTSLREIIRNGTAPYERLLEAWSPESMCARFERIVARVLDRDDPAEKCEVASIVEENPEPPAASSERPASLARRAWRTGAALSRQQLARVFPRRRKEALRQVAGTLALAATSGVRTAASGVAMALGLADARARFNRLLDDVARLEYREAVRELRALVPEHLEGALPRAHVEHAFVFDAVKRFAASVSSPRILFVGGSSRPAAAALEKLGLLVEEVELGDPMTVDPLNGGFGERSATYDCVVLTSVLQRVKDDERFACHVADLLAPGGIGILTCDFKAGWLPGDPLVAPNLRFYTKEDLERRLPACMRGVELLDAPSWHAGVEDFERASFRYALATLVFRKTAPAE